jgi:hypothetical protein
VPWIVIKRVLEVAVEIEVNAYLIHNLIVSRNEENYLSITGMVRWLVGRFKRRGCVWRCNSNTWTIAREKGPGNRDGRSQLKTGNAVAMPRGLLPYWAFLHRR